MTDLHQLINLTIPGSNDHALIVGDLDDFLRVEGHRGENKCTGGREADINVKDIEKQKPREPSLIVIRSKAWRC